MQNEEARDHLVSGCKTGKTNFIDFANAIILHVGCRDEAKDVLQRYSEFWRAYLAGEGVEVLRDTRKPKIRRCRPSKTLQMMIMLLGWLRDDT